MRFRQPFPKHTGDICSGAALGQHESRKFRQRIPVAIPPAFEQKPPSGGAAEVQIDPVLVEELRKFKPTGERP
jgi:hypothetical protein